MTRYAPGYTGPMLPAAPSRPGVKQTVTGTRPTPTVQQPAAGVRPTVQQTAAGTRPTPAPIPSSVINTRPPGMGTTGGGLPAPGTGGRPGLRMKKGGKVSSASKRADGCAIRGKTKGKMS